MSQNLENEDDLISNILIIKQESIKVIYSTAQWIAIIENSEIEDNSQFEI